jgi:hypothetical protein
LLTGSPEFSEKNRGVKRLQRNARTKAPALKQRRFGTLLNPHSIATLGCTTPVFRASKGFSEDQNDPVLAESISIGESLADSEKPGLFCDFQRNFDLNLVRMIRLKNFTGHGTLRDPLL